MSSSELVAWQSTVEMGLARLEANLQLIEDYSSIMCISSINLRAKQCLDSIDEIKKCLNVDEQVECLTFQA
jgi:hypothetical protein